MRDHSEAGQRLQPALLLDLAGRADKLANERIGQEREAVFLRVIESKGGAHVLKIERVGQSLDPAVVGIEHPAQGGRRIGVDHEVAYDGPVQADFPQRRREDLDGYAVIVRLALYELTGEFFS